MKALQLQLDNLTDYNLINAIEKELEREFNRTTKTKQHRSNKRSYFDGIKAPKRLRNI